MTDFNWDETGPFYIDPPEGAIFSLTTADGAKVWPIWQFKDGKIIDGLAEVLDTLSLGTEERWTWLLWLTAPNEDWGGKTAWQWLAEGHKDDVISEAKQDAARWRQ